ncbi:hypothetical protein OIU85_007980 [Salix viminalis]|uniref:Wall-associated receptor kinase C-terminal domain-containing protein n=1 Tax=Salix viminalis TaxID=40686 RepID=A0A9Q0PAR3_SALVM|nr:hypothetical protein OIU85_007980 [Salix viminalis]
MLIYASPPAIGLKLLSLDITIHVQSIFYFSTDSRLEFRVLVIFFRDPIGLITVAILGSSSVAEAKIRRSQSCDRLANYLASITSRGLTMFPEQITQNIYVLLSFPTPLEFRFRSCCVTLYYGCPSPSPPGFLAQFTSNIYDTDMMGYSISRNASSLISYLTTCNNSVIVPARQSTILPIPGNPNIAQLLAAINQGLELVWSANDSLCDTCKSSGGQCGCNQTTKAFTCYRADGF